MKLKIKNLLNKPWQHAEVIVFDTSKPNLDPKIRSTDHEGIVDFSEITDGRHIIRVNTGKITIEKPIKSSSRIFTLKIPAIFGRFKKKKLVDDNKYCNYCKFEYTDFLDKYKCGYCGKMNCSNHRLPENHACKNLPNRPESRFRVLHTGSKVYVE
jgi:hypothetical protein